MFEVLEVVWRDAPYLVESQVSGKEKRDKKQISAMTDKVKTDNILASHPFSKNTEETNSTLTFFGALLPLHSLRFNFRLNLSFPVHTFRGL